MPSSMLDAKPKCPQGTLGTRDRVPRPRGRGPHRAGPLHSAQGDQLGCRVTTSGEAAALTHGPPAPLGRPSGSQHSASNIWFPAHKCGDSKRSHLLRPTSGGHFDGPRTSCLHLPAFRGGGKLLWGGAGRRRSRRALCECYSDSSAVSRPCCALIKEAFKVELHLQGLPKWASTLNSEDFPGCPPLDPTFLLIGEAPRCTAEHSGRACLWLL